MEGKNFSSSGKARESYAVGPTELPKKNSPEDILAEKVRLRNQDTTKPTVVTDTTIVRREIRARARQAFVRKFGIAIAVVLPTIIGGGIAVNELMEPSAASVENGTKSKEAPPDSSTPPPPLPTFTALPPVEPPAPEPKDAGTPETSTEDAGTKAAPPKRPITRPPIDTDKQPEIVDPWGEEKR